MKTTLRFTLFISALAMAVSFLPAYGDSESDEALAKRPFLGVEVGSISRALRYHLDLDDEVGLSVNYVVVGSSAERAGLKKYDILMYFNDQLIVNNSQFSALLRRSKPGEPLVLGILRKGQEMKLEGNMGSRLDQKRSKENDNAGMQSGGTGIVIDVDEVMATASEAYEEAMEAIKEVTVEMRENEEWREHLRRAQDAIRDRVANLNTRRPPGQYSSKSEIANIVLKDDDGTLILKNAGNNMELTAIDNEGKLVFAGPINTEAERDLVPEAVMKRLEKMEVISIDGKGNFEFKDMEVLAPNVDVDISMAPPIPPLPTIPKPPVIVFDEKREEGTSL